MAAEDSKKPESEDSAKEVVKDFVQTLGLLDIILGGLTLYWVRLSLGNLSTSLFPTTGHEILDTGLLVCSAAVLGKALSLAVALLTAVCRWLLNRGDVFGYRSRLWNILDLAVTRGEAGAAKSEDYRVTPKRIEANELAIAIVTSNNADNKQEVKRLQATVSFSYSLALLLILYTRHFFHQKAASLAICLLLGVFIFFILGILNQLDLTRTLGTLLTVHLQPEEKTNENPP